MANPNRNQRPSLPERFMTFLEMSELNEFIEMLEIAYEETYNEKVFHVLTRLKDAKKRHNTLEEFYRDDELREFFEKPGLFPHSVITWMTFYRDQELS